MQAYRFGSPKTKAIRWIGICSGLLIFSLSLVMIWGLTPASASTYIYPNQGQSAEQQQRDQGDCHVWAVDQSGVDPAQVAQQPTTTTAPAQGGRLRGAAAGAAGGALVGAIAGDAGKGAAIGAATGTVVGGSRQRRANAQREAQMQQTEQQKQAAINEYNRAYKACMEGRGYTVK